MNDFLEDKSGKDRIFKDIEKAFSKINIVKTSKRYIINVLNQKNTLSFHMRPLHLLLTMS
ncbi:hypothetical protein PsalBI1_03069 [Piscirickettsia salmonis]|nr:hypothetical protein PsalBI1_03069 [Piscirickettsia salmonis]